MNEARKLLREVMSKNTLRSWLMDFNESEKLALENNIRDGCIMPVLITKQSALENALYASEQILQQRSSDSEILLIPCHSLNEWDLSVGIQTDTASLVMLGIPQSACHIRTRAVQSKSGVNVVLVSHFSNDFVLVRTRLLGSNGKKMKHSAAFRCNPFAFELGVEALSNVLFEEVNSCQRCTPKFDHCECFSADVEVSSSSALNAEMKTVYAPSWENSVLQIVSNVNSKPITRWKCSMLDPNDEIISRIPSKSMLIFHRAEFQGSLRKKAFQFIAAVAANRSTNMTRLAPFHVPRSVQQLEYSSNSLHLSDDESSKNSKINHNESVQTIEGERPTKRSRGSSGNNRTCEICGTVFRQKQHLIDHKNALHLRIKPYVCDICGHAYSVASNLRQHIRLKHKNIESQLSSHSVKK